VAFERFGSRPQTLLISEKTILKPLLVFWPLKLATHFELIGGALVAGDSTKLRAQNSKKNNFNPNKIERHIAYIDARLDEYNATFQRRRRCSRKQSIAKKIKKHSIQKQNTLGIKIQLILLRYSNLDIGSR
jgi:hypothetical protein